MVWCLHWGGWGTGESSYHARIYYWVSLRVEPDFQNKIWFHAVSNVQLFTSEEISDTFQANLLVWENSKLWEVQQGQSHACMRSWHSESVKEIEAEGSRHCVRGSLSPTWKSISWGHFSGEGGKKCMRSFPQDILLISLRRSKSCLAGFYLSPFRLNPDGVVLEYLRLCKAHLGKWKPKLLDMNDWMQLYYIQCVKKD